MKKTYLLVLLVAFPLAGHLYSLKFVRVLLLVVCLKAKLGLWFAPPAAGENLSGLRNVGEA